MYTLRLSTQQKNPYCKKKIMTSLQNYNEILERDWLSV